MERTQTEKPCGDPAMGTTFSISSRAQHPSAARFKATTGSSFRSSRPIAAAINCFEWHRTELANTHYQRSQLEPSTTGRSKWCSRSAAVDKGAHSLHHPGFVNTVEQANMGTGQRNKCCRPERYSSEPCTEAAATAFPTSVGSSRQAAAWRPAVAGSETTIWGSSSAHMDTCSTTGGDSSSRHLGQSGDAAGSWTGTTSTAHYPPATNSSTAGQRPWNGCSDGISKTAWSTSRI